MKKVLISVMTVALIVALTAPVYAAFTPSAESKYDTEVVEQDDGIAAVIVDSTTGVQVKDVGTQELIVTPGAKKRSAPVSSITNHLNRAETQIKRTEDLTDLTPELHTSLDAVKQAAEATADIQNVRVDDLAVSDLFDVTYLVNGRETPIGEGNKITFTVKTKLKQGEVFFVMHNYKDNDWEMVDDVKLADNGDLTITVDSLSPFAIIVDKTAYLTPDPVGPTSPKTGEMTNYAYLASTVALLACAAFLCLKGSKRTEA